MKGYASVQIFNGSGKMVSQVVMTKRTMYIGRSPATGGFDDKTEHDAQFVLVPQECRGVSKIRHIRIQWRPEPTPSFVAEVVGRCNGACIMGTLYREGGTVRLPEDSVSTLSVGQSCYIFFSPAIRVHNTTRLLIPQPSLDADAMGSDGAADPAGPKPSVSAKRFPKLWSKAIMDVFTSMGDHEIPQYSLIARFKQVHSSAVKAFFGEFHPDLDNELWSNLKRFVTKAPFEFDPVSTIVRFDPQAVKARAPKKQRVSDDGDEETAMVEETAVPEQPDAAVLVD